MALFVIGPEFRCQDISPLITWIWPHLMPWCSTDSQVSQASALNLALGDASGDLNLSSYSPNPLTSGVLTRVHTACSVAPRLFASILSGVALAPQLLSSHSSAKRWNFPIGAVGFQPEGLIPVGFASGNSPRTSRWYSHFQLTQPICSLGNDAVLWVFAKGPLKKMLLQ